MKKGTWKEMDYRGEIRDYIRLEIEILGKMDIDAINDALNLLHDTLQKEGNIYIFGNGGSSLTASHFQNDFNKGISENMVKKFRFHCLNDNIATVMAIANDFNFEEVFRYQLTGRMKPDDIVIAISGSGNSRNVLNAVEYAKAQDCKVIGLTGYDGGALKELSDISLHVPVNSMQITEDLHMMLDHLMMSVFNKTLCGIQHLRS